MWLFNPLWLLVAGVLTFVCWYTRNQFSFWSKRSVPFIEPHWLFGNFGDWIKDKVSMAELTSKMYKEFKGKRFVGIWRLFSPTLFAIDPELIQHVLVKDYVTWSGSGLPFNPDIDPLSATLLNLDGKKWKSVRSKLTPFFTPGKLKQMLNLILDCGKDFEKYLETLAATGGIVEARDMSARFIMDVNASCALGISMNSLSDENSFYDELNIQAAGMSLQQNVVEKLHVVSHSLFKLLRVRLHTQKVSDLFLNIVKQNFEDREKENMHRHDFMDLLRSLKNTAEPLGPDGIEFDDKLLAAQAFDFFLGGFESTSGVISFCLHELATNEKIQDKLREEVHETKAANNGEITWDGLNSMKYLDMVVQETLRKYPTTAYLLRKSVKPYQIPGTAVELPAGIVCIIPVYAIHHDPEYYPDPEKFDPERFTDEVKNQRPSSTFLPFGDGPKNCIGLRLGEHQVKVTLIKLLDNFRVSLCEKSQNPIELCPGKLLLFPKDGVWLRVSRYPSN